MNYEEFKYYNTQLKYSGMSRPATIDERDLKLGTCKVDGKPMKIEEAVKNVLSQKYYLTNASSLTQWKGFRERNKAEKVAPMKKQEPIKQSDPNRSNIEKLLNARKIESENAPFEVVFNPKDSDNPEIYYYNNRKDAEEHLEMFKDDDSGLYKTIALINSNKNEVYRILYFGKSDTCLLDLSIDDIVKLKPEYSTELERKYYYSVHNINDHNCGCIANCLNSNLSLGSSEHVGLEMIYTTGKTLFDVLK